MKKLFSLKAAAAVTAVCASLLLGIFAGTMNLPAADNTVQVCSGKGPGSVWDNY